MADTLSSLELKAVSGSKLACNYYNASNFDGNDPEKVRKVLMEMGTMEATGAFPKSYTSWPKMTERGGSVMLSHYKDFRTWHPFANRPILFSD